MVAVCEAAIHHAGLCILSSVQLTDQQFAASDGSAKWFEPVYD